MKKYAICLFVAALTGFLTAYLAQCLAPAIAGATFWKLAGAGAAKDALLWLKSHPIETEFKTPDRMWLWILSPALAIALSGCAGAASMIRAAGKDTSAATLQIRSIYATVIYSRSGGSTNQVEISETGTLKQNK